MRFACTRFPLAPLLLIFAVAPQQICASSITASPKPTPSTNRTATCEFRTINYITDSLPQSCFKSSWSADSTTTRVVAAETVGGEGVGMEAVVTPASNATKGEEKIQGGTEEGQYGGQSTPDPSRTSTPAATETAVAEDLEASELNEASFLSFEEWKKQALEKAGQQNAQIGGRKANPAENKKRDPESLQNSLGPYGEEGEIDIDFGVFRGSGDGNEVAQAADIKNSKTPEAQVEEKTEKRTEHRSKDAGKTCKERFSYASFDAGATVVKTHQGAKNSKAVLIENKDSYMLSECSKENKFIIIELSEDIWIDTVVLANYEFFSSMIRTFRVTVSDRYPLKTEKWKDIGVYEARNSRDIQAFLIENPQIWARYIRIEFLSHYGNEYYCPLSLVRVHGTRMLESWKESESIGEDDDAEEDDPEMRFENEAVAKVIEEEERRNAEIRSAAVKMVQNAQATAIAKSDAAEKALLENGTSPWIKYSFPMANSTNTPIMDDICLPEQAHVQEPSSQTSEALRTATPEPSSADRSITMDANVLSKRSDAMESGSDKTSTTKVPTPVTSIASHMNGTASSSDSVVVPSSQQVTTQPSKTQIATSTLKNKTSSISSSSSASPTQQESFFKAVSRRLQLLETNSTLSLKYIEEQSKILREAFAKVEKKQTQKSTTFLDTLNNTVLAELRGFRQQYDEIWQSTIISLESQKEESRREIFAISARLNILADEVVFQKRMSIVQSVLLLLCLGLVIFSRVSASGQVEMPNFSSRFLRNISSESPIQSPAFSPQFHRMDSIRSQESWGRPGHSRPQSGDFGISRSRSRDGSQTPISSYSRSEYDFTPPSAEEHLVESTEFSPEPRPEHLEPPRPQSYRRRSHSASGKESPGLVSSTQTSLDKHPHRRKPSSIRQVASPPPTDTERATTSTDTTPGLLDLGYVNRSQIGLALGSPALELPEQELVDGEVGYVEEGVENGVENGAPTPTTSSFRVARKPLPALPKGE